MKTLGRILWDYVELWSTAQKINVAMDAMGTMGHYSIYVALLQILADTCRWPRIC